MPKSVTFTVANGSRVTVHRVKEQVPTGLMRVVWKRCGDDITVVVDGEVHERVGSLMGTGPVAWSLGSFREVRWANTLNRQWCEQFADRPPFLYKTEEAAFDRLVRWIKSEMGGPKWTAVVEK